MIISKTDFSRRRQTAIGINIIIGIIHFLGPGSYLRGSLKEIYYSYFSDLVIPFAFYFLLCAAELKIIIFKSWKIKLAICFLLPAAAETAQLFGVHVLGATFDPIDYLIYGIGACAAAVTDSIIFPKWAGKLN